VKHGLKMENGYWSKTESPGLGIEVDEVAATKHPFKQEAFATAVARAADGAILDW
jgi:galactonate dehydratase